MPRLFVDTSGAADGRATLGADGVRHLRALRLGAGDRFEAIVAPGEVREATVETLGRREATLRLGESVSIGDVDPARPLVLAVALADLARFDGLIEKATELGATSIRPFRASRSQVGRLTGSRLERWRRIARAACEQCGRTRPPEIAEDVELSALIASACTTAHVVVLDPRAATPWDGAAPPERPLVLVIGPEGGFADEEITSWTAAGAARRSLGPRVLRFETAAAAALAIAVAREGARWRSADPSEKTPS